MFCHMGNDSHAMSAWLAKYDEVACVSLSMWQDMLM
jgi:hypothetical protein